MLCKMDDRNALFLAGSGMNGMCQVTSNQKYIARYALLDVTAHQNGCTSRQYAHDLNLRMSMVGAVGRTCCIQAADGPAIARCVVWGMVC
jgi:hypothetical protein